MKFYFHQHGTYKSIVESEKGEHDEFLIKKNVKWIGVANGRMQYLYI